MAARTRARIGAAALGYLQWRSAQCRGRGRGLRGGRLDDTRPGFQDQIEDRPRFRRNGDPWILRDKGHIVPGSGHLHEKGKDGFIGAPVSGEIHGSGIRSSNTASVSRLVSLAAPRKSGAVAKKQLIRRRDRDRSQIARRAGIGDLDCGPVISNTVFGIDEDDQ